jgi:hypothetical protein
MGGARSSGLDAFNQAAGWAGQPGSASYVSVASFMAFGPGGQVGVTGGHWGVFVCLLGLGLGAAVCGSASYVSVASFMAFGPGGQVGVTSHPPEVVGFVCWDEG